MTVKELKAALEGVPDDARVWLKDLVAVTEKRADYLQDDGGGTDVYLFARTS